MKYTNTLLVTLTIIFLAPQLLIAQGDIEIKSDGDIVFLSDTSSIVFPPAIGVTDAMLYMFSSGISNSPRMVLGHSPSYPNWGLEYDDGTDRFFFRSNTGRHLTMDLTNGRLGVGTEAPFYPLHVYAPGVGNSYIRISDATTGLSDGLRLGLNGLGSAYVLNDYTGGTINLGTNGGVDAILEADGDMRFNNKVGAASTSPAFPIDVRDDTYDRAGYFYNNKSSTSTTFGLFGGAYGTGSGDKRGGSFDAIGGTGTNIGVRGFAQNGTTNVGVYGYASGGTTNYAAHFDAGDVKVDDHMSVGGVNPSASYVFYVSESNNNAGAGYFYNTRSDAGSSYGLVSYGLQSGSGSGYGIYASGTTFAVYSVGNQYVSGDIRIGHTDDVPGYRLSVNGDAICEELKVQNSTSWPDYVFAEDYRLLPIETLAEAIDRDGHLPGMPSADEVAQAGGIEVGDMQKKLLEKVEELTLYVIQLNQKNKELEDEVNSLRKQINNK